MINLIRIKSNFIFIVYFWCRNKSYNDKTDFTFGQDAKPIKRKFENSNVEDDSVDTFKKFKEMNVDDLNVSTQSDQKKKKKCDFLFWKFNYFAKAKKIEE